MKYPSETELKELLTMNQLAEAPAGLAERIKAEIPDDFASAQGGYAASAAEGREAAAAFAAEGREAAAASAAEGREPAAAGPPRRFGSHGWLAMAASLTAVVGGSFLTYSWLREAPLRPAMEETRIAEASALQPSAVEAVSPEEAPDLRAGERAGEARGEREAGRKDEDFADARDRGAAVAADREVGQERLYAAVTAPEAAPPPAALSEPLAKSAARPVELQSSYEKSVKQAIESIRAEYKELPESESQLREAMERMVRVDQADDATARRSAETLVRESQARAKRRVAPPLAASPAAPANRLMALGYVAGAEEPAAETERRRQLAPPSTGGTAEPNDAPYGDVFFRGYGVNPFVDTEDDARSTFGLDVDTGSYTVVRRYLSDGHLPPPEAVRVEELVNYFDYGDEPPAEGDFAIHAEGAPSIFAHGERYYLLRFNVHGREVATEDRPPALLTFVVDVSGSMARENRLGLVKKALALLIDQLRADDRVALVVYGSRGQVLLEPTGDHGAIRRAVDGLRPGGSTNVEEGLRLAYELADRHRRRGTINRVILCSDGVANVGRTGPESILGQIRRHADQGIELTTVGFGMGNYNDVLMERLADTGNGRYAYVDQLDEARRIFVDNLTGTLLTIAAEARVQVEFNPEVVARYRLLGYENRDIADDRFRDDTVDAGEIGAGHSVTALYEIKLHGDLGKRDRVATLHLRWASIAAGEMVETAYPVTGADFAARWEKASPALRLTSLVAEFGEILKQTYWAKEGSLEDVFRRAQQVSADFAGDREVADFVSLAGRAADTKREE